MRRRYIVPVALAFVIAAAAFYAGIGGIGAYEKSVVDELGEVHEVVVAGPYVVIKHQPSRHQVGGDFHKMMKYVEARRASWERWRRLVDKYGGEEYLAYVVPCKILTYDEFNALAKALGITDEVVGIITYTYYKNGTYALGGFSLRPEGASFEDWLSDTYEADLAAVGHYVLLRQWRRAGNATRPPFNWTRAIEVGRSVADVYVGAFEVKTSLKKLYSLSKRPEILMVDTPLDLIWRYREDGKIVEVKRITTGDRYMVEKRNLCP